MAQRRRHGARAAVRRGTPPPGQRSLTHLGAGHDVKRREGPGSPDRRGPDAASPLETISPSGLLPVLISRSFAAGDTFVTSTPPRTDTGDTEQAAAPTDRPRRSESRSARPPARPGTRAAAPCS